jgi:type IV pilus assembly protein PilA
MFSSVLERLNDRRDAAGDIGEDAGFTLIELMVVLLILAILLAIAIPTFLGVTGGANDRAAQSNLNTALTTAKAAATQNNQAYGGGSSPVTLALLQANEPSIHWVVGPTATQGDVSFFVSADNEGIVLASPSKNIFTGTQVGTCWYAVDNLVGLTAPAGGAYGATLGGVGTATQAPSNAGSFYASGSQSAGKCDAAAATVGAIPLPWKTNGF